MQHQRVCTKCTGKFCECDLNIAIDDRSYVFLLYPLDMTSVLNPDLYTVRVPFRNMVVGILAHQMLIQTICSALLQNLNHVTPILNILQINTCSLRGILTHVNAKHVSILLQCLETSNHRSKEFDLRPGLKFLTQKVGNLSRAANLYTQANTADVVEIIVLIELCLDGIEKYGVSPNDLRQLLLKKEEKKKLLTDLDYVEDFLRKLQDKWNNLCESYMSLTISIPKDDQISDDEIDEDEIKCKNEKENLARYKEERSRSSEDKRDVQMTIEERRDIALGREGRRDALNKEEKRGMNTNREVTVSIEKKDDNKILDEKQKKPFRFADLKRSDSFSSTDSESYLEREILPTEEDGENIQKEEEKPHKEKAHYVEETVTLIHHNDAEEKTVKYKYNVDINIKYDANTLMQMRASASNDSIVMNFKGKENGGGYDKEIEQKVEAMLEQYKKRKPGQMISPSLRSNPFISTQSPLPPAQPVPPEIQQQRALSIAKDAEAYKCAKVETMEVCVELLCSLSSDRLSPLALVLKDGAVSLLAANEEKIRIAAENLLQKMNISYVDADNLEV